MKTLPSYLIKLFVLCLAVNILTANGLGQVKQRQASKPILSIKLHKLIDSYLTSASDFGFSGVVLVGLDEKIKFERAYGMADQVKKVPNAIDTVFDTGSVTKQFTAAGIMKLEMMGKLKTEDPINKYLDGVPDDKAKVTIHQLLTHTAGFPEYSGGDYERSERDETVKRILSTPLDFEPGTADMYSNAGYSVLAAIIEKVSGTSYEAFLNENLFEPAGMTHTGYILPKFDKSRLPHGYVLGKDQKTVLDHLWSEQGPYWNLMGNGGILSTANDMFKWYKALQGNAIFSDDAKKKMFTPTFNDYAYGWEIGKTAHGKTIGHNGGNDVGFTAHIRWFPESGVCVIVMSNSGYYFDTGNYSNLVGKKIAGLVFGETLPLQRPAKFINRHAQDLKRFQGTYDLPSGGRLNVNEVEGQLVVLPEGQDATNLLSQSAAVPVFEKASKVSKTILESISKKDFGPFTAVFEKQDIARRYQAYLEKKMKDWEAKEGAFNGFQILGTVFDWWGDNSTPITFVKMNYEKQSHLFRFHWKDGKIFAIGGEGIPNPAITPLKAISQNEFAGWHLGFAKPFRLKFRQTTNGKTVMIVVADGRTVITTRH